MTGARDRLMAELTQWHAESRTPRLWWRDDDAVAPTEALARLIDSARGRPLALAVIPAEMQPTLARCLPDSVTVLPHGYAHRNHEPPERKKAEFGATRNLGAARHEIETGVAMLAQAFGDAFLPLFVPPWNRIDPTLAARLPEFGLAGLSTYNDRPPNDPVARLNTHVDILDWKHKRKTGKAAFIGEEIAYDLLTDAFRRRRLCTAGTDPGEPVGLLTHHLEHDEACWAFLTDLSGWGAFKWVDARTALEEQ